ncbi:MAG: Ribosomal protein L3 N(5)-glutamine methyltransferase [Gammaproteobacteria bacterium]|nr:Ribosomal protein L3 N(5)-glutamine methyltransferase [Gammaproteobacteria bacterium]
MPTTPREFLTYAEQQFSAADLCYGHGTDNPADEAAYLVLRALSLPFAADTEVLDRPLERRQKEHLRELIDHRIRERIPVAYLVNEAWFAGMPFYVDQRVIIPRSPLAELIVARFTPWLQETQVRRILDIGTGSGCIAIACACAFPEARVDATDSVDAALAVAKKNIDTYQLTNRVRLFKANVFEGLPPAQYDLIVSNPPYVSAAEVRDLPAEYRHEPEQALLAGTDGLTVVSTILQQASGYLAEHGLLIIEVGNSQAAVMEAFPNLPFTWLEFEYGGEGVLLLTAEDLPQS